MFASSERTGGAAIRILNTHASGAPTSGTGQLPVSFRRFVLGKPWADVVTSTVRPCRVFWIGTRPYVPKQLLARRIENMLLEGAGGLHDEQRGLEHFGYVGDLVQLRLWPLEEDSARDLVDEC